MESESIESRLNAKNPDVIQLFSAATANGVKVAAALEEIAAERQCDNFYEAHTVRIRASENYAPFFLKLNPTGKIPVIVDSHAKETGPVEEREVTLFESGAILMYLAERYDVLLPKDFNLRYKTIEWLFWGSSEFSAQCKLFGFYFKYCTHSLPYCTDRAKLKVERLLRALETQLSHGKHYVIGDMYTIADISIWPWVAALFDVYDDAIATCFDNFKCYPNVMNWYNRCMQRVASKKAFDVCTFQDEGLPTKAETNAAKHYGEGRKIPLGDASGKAIGLE
jgi:GST-like protein